ncbi:uncharacterized protein J4E78_008562 [Alternaria triticimaculans]|uniref:uncharacterized protein n=1 Tax=Alternaria triticimaculans TaxID=297637 RepID=UPI0020C22DB6|nr:uncharacterized protein J4E78_008562 [Alternaria triticimaculans]KAI4649044.1 hypothetical protein J4E78_008562 [Alternaria triticimaculans]
MVERAGMFAQGHHEKLLKALNGEERSRALSDWLYQYWFFCFKTAKHWGKGPRIWTAELLNFEQYLSTGRSSLPGTPQDLTHGSTPHSDDEPTPPSDLCRWYVHVHEQRYEPIPEDVSEPRAFPQPDPDDDTTWASWSPSEQQASLQAHLRNALEHNDFSPTPAADLPVAIPQIAKAADEERSSELLVESLGFSIMSRNLDQIERLFLQLRAKHIDPALVHPFHLATSFLDGSKSCCDVFVVVSQFVPPGHVSEMYLDEHGHTILDNLMITIIKSHTSAKPVVVDDNLKDVSRFIGEEVDICGRWDADSPCCDHEELTAAGLAEEIQSVPAFETWNTELRTGWTALAGVLRRCETAHVEQVGNKYNDAESSDDDVHFMGSTEPDRNLLDEHRYGNDIPLCFYGRKDLGTLWCSVQAEYLSYRRLNDGLAWTSRYFSMETLRKQLEQDEDLVVGYAEYSLLKAHCACHSFGRFPMTLLDDAIDPNLANLDVWGRATYEGIDFEWWE